MDWLPAHKASLRLTHNEHKDYYQTVGVWDEDGSILAGRRARAA